MTGIDELKYPASRTLLYAGNITDHIKNIEASEFEYERAEWMKSIGYDIAELEKMLPVLKAAYNQVMQEPDRT